VLRFLFLVSVVIAITNLIGFSTFALQVMDGMIRTVILVLMGWFMHRLIRTLIEAMLQYFPSDRFTFLKLDVNGIKQRMLFFADAFIIFLLVSYLLVVWKLYAIPADVMQDFLVLKLPFGEQQVTIGLVILAALIVYGSFLLSWSLQAMFKENVLSRYQLDRGARHSIMRLMHYAIVLLGFFIAIGTLGFELRNIAIIGGALSVGIGFGMQSIVKNFVSGLILLFNRTITVGDVIRLNDGQEGWVMTLGQLSTRIQTFDRAEVVVPNGDLLTNQMTNWTLSDRMMRLTLPVGVAYGSDVETVIRVLKRVSRDNPQVLEDPQPMVLFNNFGDSSLDFELWVWISDFDEHRFIQSALNREIDRRFRAERIEIPFPQRDLHLRSADTTIA
jgi:small-conductance mechanosensitive channel